MVDVPKEFADAVYFSMFFPVTEAYGIFMQDYEIFKTGQTIRIPANKPVGRGREYLAGEGLETATFCADGSEGCGSHYEMNKTPKGQKLFTLLQKKSQG